MNYLVYVWNDGEILFSVYFVELTQAELFASVAITGYDVVKAEIENKNGDTIRTFNN